MTNSIYSAAVRNLSQSHGITDLQAYRLLRDRDIILQQQAEERQRRTAWIMRDMSWMMVNAQYGKFASPFASDEAPKSVHSDLADAVYYGRDTPKPSLWQRIENYMKGRFDYS